MLKKLFLTGVSLAFSGSMAFAAADNVKAEAPEVTPCPSCFFTYSTGPYIGLDLGGRSNYISAPAAYKGLETTLLLGYTAMLGDAFYLSIEAFGQDSASLQDYRSRVGAEPLGAKSTWGYGLSLLPGLLLNDRVLGYLRFGVVSTRFTNVNNTAIGGQAGVGLQTPISKHFDLRAEYTYTFYNSISQLGNPKADLFNLGVVYHF